MAGIDFGNMNCYLAVARNKGIEILMNDYSLHATPACISFGESTRLMGYGARQQLNIHFRNTVLNFKYLLGRNFADPVVQSFRPFIPTAVVQLPSNSIGFQVNHLGEQRVFSGEQILACLFTHLRHLLAKSMGREVTECVLNVPYFFGEQQRIAVLTAGRIAGVNFRLVNDHAALAYNYGMYKGSELPKEEEPSKLVAFVDCGHSSVQASIVAFNAGKAQILGASHDLGIGGLHFDSILRDHFAAQFKEKYKLEVRQSPRAWLRLLDECEKLKKQMSAYSQSIPFGIECFMNDVDVSGSMQRAQFEELIAPMLQKLRSLLGQAVQAAKVGVEQITDVELIGGSSRVPCVKQTIAEFFGQEPRTTMNQDDAVARGCALRCAMFYPVYQMKEFQLNDPYDLAIDSGKVPSEEALVELLNAEQEMQAADLREKERSDAKNTLEEFCFKVQHAMEDEQLCQGKLADDLRLACMSECQKVLDWVDTESEQLQKKQIECRREELEQFCAPMMNQLYAVAEEMKEEGEADMENGGQKQQPPPPNGQPMEETNEEQPAGKTSTKGACKKSSKNGGEQPQMDGEMQGGQPIVEEPTE